MTIKTKLLLSYLAMTFIPVLLFAIIVVPIASHSLGIRGDAGNAGGVPAFWKAANEREGLVFGLRFLARADADKFADPAFLADTEEQLADVHAGIVVLRGDEAVYVSPMANGTLYDKLNDRRNEAGEASASFRLGGRYAAERIVLTFGDGRKGEAFVVSDLKKTYEKARAFFPLMIGSLLLVIALTNGFLTFLVSRSLAKPLFALKRAALRIKDGDLQHEVSLNRRDEIGQVGEAFEEMRVRLNDSLVRQLQYEENRKELVSGISHDLKTPIAGIKACLEGIRDGIANTDEKRDNYIGMIGAKTEQMDRLIDELTLFSKLDLKQWPFELEEIDLNAYLRDCVLELRLDPRTSGVRVVFAGPGEASVPVLADREKLRRLIENVWDNSLKYMDKDGEENKEMGVELICGEDTVTARFFDNGPGIPAEALPRVFDRFYRAEPSRNPATGGSGLGLAIARQIAEGHGGGIRAESGGEQAGTSIYLTLPKPRKGGERA